METTSERPGSAPKDFIIQQLTMELPKAHNKGWKSKVSGLIDGVRKSRPDNGDLNQLMQEADNLMFELGE